MSEEKTAPVHDLSQLRDRAGVFDDRQDAGKALARMLSGKLSPDAIILAVPAGGVPVAAVVARSLGLELDLAVVSKVTPSWNTEAGYGAVAFDGTVRLDEDLMRLLGVGAEEARRGVRAASEKVRRRLGSLRADKPPPRLADRETVLVDDGLASGTTMLTAVEALRRAGAGRIVLAVPTAHSRAIARLRPHVDEIYCPNVRGGWVFAVADAYRHWHDVSEDQAREILLASQPPGRKGP